MFSRIVGVMGCGWGWGCEGVYWSWCMEFHDVGFYRLRGTERGEWIFYVLTCWRSRRSRRTGLLLLLTLEWTLRLRNWGSIDGRHLWSFKVRTFLMNARQISLLLFFLSFLPSFPFLFLSFFLPLSLCSALCFGLFLRRRTTSQSFVVRASSGQSRL